jgi:hypothetical protein
LAEALADARAARESRAAVWAALEPADSQAAGFAETVITASRRQGRRSRLWQFSRFGTAAAACLLLGYFAGWVGHGRGGAAGGGDLATDIGRTTVVDHRIQIAPPVPSPAAESAGVLLTEIQVKNPPRPPRPMLVVSEVTSPPPAGGAGLEVGDLLLSVDGEHVPNVATLAAVLGSRRASGHTLQIVRDGKFREITVRFDPRRPRR